MQRKKINFNSKTKLRGVSQELNAPEMISSLNILGTDTTAKTTSFRLRLIDAERLETTLKKVNDYNESHHFNKTDLIRGLIMLGLEEDSKKVLDYIRKSF